jgi:Mg2+-importing ATPase
VVTRQFRNAVLLLLITTAVASALLGNGAEAAIIGVVLVVSVALGAANEYRAERAAAALANTVPATAIVIRDGREFRIDADTLVDGDLVRLTLGARVPADGRLISVSSLECDESAVTGESAPRVKSIETDPAGTPISDSGCLVLSSSVVAAGSGLALVVATGQQTLAGSRNGQLARRLPETAFQHGLARFSRLLLYVAAILVAVILITGIVLHRSLVETLLFALTIAVGVTPQLLPAVVSSSLAQGARSLARRRVLIKRLVCIEDLGNVTTLITDKTGTLTEGHLAFERALDPEGLDGSAALRWARMALVEAGGPDGADNPLDQALLATPMPPELPVREIVGGIPFDHERTMASTLVRSSGSQTLVVTGAPEAVIARCSMVPQGAQNLLARELTAGGRVIAVATRPFLGEVVARSDESGLTLIGFLVFNDPLRMDASAALERLASLGVQVVIATGDHPLVAAQVAARLGHSPDAVLTGTELNALDDEGLRARLVGWTIVARVLPEQKERLVNVLRARGDTVAFLGDGVNDALALHAADAGISVVTATDVAREAADIVLLDKSLDVVADGVQEGRRIFQNTMKYLLMGTSANFGNMLSASAASAFLPFLPMLPTQVLLNNLLYDSSQLAISTDRVDPELTRRPAHWNLGLIRRYMLIFGAMSSIFDLITFAILLGSGTHAAGFQTGWFIESLATQGLVVLVIRTRRFPFFRSRPGALLSIAVLAAIAVGWVIPFTPLGRPFGFAVPTLPMLLALGAVIVVYVVLIDMVKWWFFRPSVARRPVSSRA